MTDKITVRIDSSRPIFIEADADNFGQLFASMGDEDQVNVLRAMVEHMKPHRIQWDYIAIALEKDENRDVRDQLSVILPDIAAKDAEIEHLREALGQIVQTNQIREFMGDDKGDGYGDQGWVVRDGQYAKIARAALNPESAK